MLHGKLRVKSDPSRLILWLLKQQVHPLVFFRVGLRSPWNCVYCVLNEYKPILNPGSGSKLLELSWKQGWHGPLHALGETVIMELFQLFHMERIGAVDGTLQVVKFRRVVHLANESSPHYYSFVPSTDTLLYIYTLYIYIHYIYIILF